LVGVAGLLRQGVTFDAWNGAPVDSLFLTLTPDDRPEEHCNDMGRLVAIGPPNGTVIVRRKNFLGLRAG